MASFLLQLHYFDLLEEELAARAAKEKNKERNAQKVTKKSNRERLSENMCTNSQMEKIVKYMEINGDLAKLTYRGGSLASRSLADAGWKELAALVNTGDAGPEKTHIQLRRSWGDFKSKIRKKSVKLEEYKDLPVGKAPPALSELEMRVLALEKENSVDPPADGQASSSTVDGSEPEVNESAVWQATENFARHNLELPLPTAETQVKKEMVPYPVQRSPEKTQVKITLTKVTPKNVQEEHKSSPKDLFLMTPNKQASSKANNNVVDFTEPVISHANLNKKTQDVGDITNGAPNISTANLDPPISPNIEYMEMERRFAHLTQIYEQTHTIVNNGKKQNTCVENTNKSVEKYVKDIGGNGPKSKNIIYEQTKTNGKKIDTCIEDTNKKLEEYLKNINDTRNESKNIKKFVIKRGIKRDFSSNGNLHEKENQNPDDVQDGGESRKKAKVRNTEDVVSLFLENMKEQRQLEMKREHMRMEIEQRRLENERESLRQRDVQLAQNAQILNVVVQLAELTERVLNKRNQ